PPCLPLPSAAERGRRPPAAQEATCEPGPRLRRSDLSSYGQNSTFSWICRPLPPRLQRRLPRILRLRAEFLLDAQQLIVFRGPVRARERTGLDLPAIGCNGEICDGRIFGLAGAVRHHRGIARLVRHLDGRERFGYR